MNTTRKESIPARPKLSSATFDTGSRGMKNIPRNDVLHRARLRAGLTQNQLALSVGVPEFIVTKLETKRRKLDEGLAQKLSLVLKVSVKQLEGGALV